MRRYLDVLDDLLHSYNNTHHHSIRTAPSEVNVDNENIVRARLYPVKPKTYRWKYAVGYERFVCKIYITDVSAHSYISSLPQQAQVHS